MSGIMRRLGPWGVALVLCCCLGANSFPAMAQEEPVRTYVFFDEPFSPFTLGDVGGVAYGGISLEILKELFSRMGAAVEVRLFPWARVVKSVEFGRADGIPLLMQDEERDSFLAFSDTVVENREFLYYLPERLGEFDWDEFEDLKGYVFGLVSGYTYSKPFTQALQEYGYTVLYSTDSERSLHLLMAGRVDFIVDDELLMGPRLDKYPIWKAMVHPVGKPISFNSYRMGISRLSPLAERVDEINQALASMREDGSLEAILERR